MVTEKMPDCLGKKRKRRERNLASCTVGDLC